MTTKERAKCGKRAGLVGVLCNFLSGVGMISVGAVSGSVAMIAEGIYNLTNGFFVGEILAGIISTVLEECEKNTH